MGQLIHRLQDAAKSGVYRTNGAEPVADAVRGSKLSFARIALHDVASKRALMHKIAATLGFPDSFGQNWDALEDCLTDLSWCDAQGHVLVFQGFQFLPQAELGMLIDTLISAAEFWPALGKPFFAVFVDPERTLMLADLYSEP
jgi:RNAse (barnase) inhibitor barstar